MSSRVTGPEIEALIQLLAKLPGLGPRSARRAALHLIKKKDQVLRPLAHAAAEAADKVSECERCGKKYGNKHELVRHSKAKLGCPGIKIP